MTTNCSTKIRANTEVKMPDTGWGPNADGWTLLVHNECAWDLSISTDSHIELRPGWIGPSCTGEVKGAESLWGGPADCAFTLVARNRGECGEHGSVVVMLTSKPAGPVTRTVSASGEVTVVFPEQRRDRVQEIYIRNNPWISGTLCEAERHDQRQGAGGGG